MQSSLPSTIATRRQVLRSLAGFSASVLFAGCNKAQMVAASPVNLQAASAGQPVPSGPLTQALLTVGGVNGSSIGADFMGLSYEKSTLCEPLFSADNADLIALFKLLGAGVLRIGGNSADQCVWNPKGLGQTAGQIAPSDVQALGAFLRATGWQCLYAVNLGGAATGSTTPQLAAAEVAYASQQLGGLLVGVEIGNECDGYGASGSYFAGNWSLAQFETLWMQYRAAITAAAPNVAVTGPASGSNVANWTVPFGQAMGKQGISQLTQHYYRGDGKSANSTAANLISTDNNLTKCLGMLSAASQTTGLPFRIAECNSYFNGGAVGVSNTYASALWVLDFLFGCAQGGASGVNLHGGGNANGYTPIADQSGTVVGARPEYYGMTLFTLAGQGELCQTSLSANGLNVTAYAVMNSTGRPNLVIVNKDATQNLQLSISLPEKVTSASLLTMSQNLGQNPSLTATSGITIQSSAISADGTFNPASPNKLTAGDTQLNCYVPALSAVLIQTA